MSSTFNCSFETETMAMKNSETYWIGAIPAHWNRTALLNCLRSSISDGPHETPLCVDEGIPFVSIDSLNDSKNVDLTVVKKFISQSDYERYCKKTVLERGDILFTKAATIGKTAIVSSEKMMVWSPIAIIKADYQIIDQLFLYYTLSNSSFIEYVKRLGSYNTQANIGMRELEKAIIPVPPLYEQRRIGTLIDHIVTCIDSIITSESQLISKCNEYKISIISEAITKGLDSDVPMKDSGIQWIGPIPESWDIVPIKSRFKINKRIAGKLGFDVLSVTQDGVKIKDISSNDGQLSNDYSKYQLVYKGDFVMNHMDLLTGFVDCSPYDGVTSPDYRVFTLESDDLCPRYALYILQMGYRNRIFYGMGQGVSSLGRWRLPKEQFLNFEFPLPPLNVQESIVSYLDSKCKVIDSLISEYSESIVRLNEFKQSLVYEYVTGKRTVPEEVI